LAVRLWQVSAGKGNHITMTGVGRTYLLLIVDDDETDRRLYARLLARHAPGAFEIVQAADGARGLITLRSRKFDCVLLDFNLPDMTGLEFLTDAMGGGSSPSAFILVTGQGNEMTAVEAMKLGVQDYLVKSSIDEDKLWQAIKRAVSQAELRQRLDTSLRDLSLANVALEQEIASRRAAEVELHAARDAGEEANVALVQEIATHRATEVELRAAKEVADEANRAKTRFVAMITHELRTPLNGVLGYTQLLRMEGGLSDQQGARIDAMMRAGQHLQEMIEHVLDFASIESGEMRLRPVAVSVRELTEGSIGFIGPMATERGLDLRIVSPPGAPRKIAADPARLRQVLLNLLSNAVKFTSVGSVELRVLAGATKGDLRLEVADTGPGIDEADRQRLFRDFERLNADISVEGAGLGLAITARIVRLMGGTIGHEPNIGGGSVFWLELPMGTAAVSLADAVHAPEWQDTQPVRLTQALHVLVVDDILMNRDIAGALLRVAGHEVTCAESGAEAVAAVASTDFDVVLMDVRMPVMDGLEATRRIRALKGARGRVPIVALTAQALTDHVAECLEAGMDSHLAKPFGLDALVAAVVNAVSAGKRQGMEPAPVPVPTIIPVGSANAPMASELSILDPIVFDRTAAFLTAEAVVSYLGAIASLGETLLRGLRASDASMSDDNALAETAHKLAGSAGMFGFERLATLGRRFELAVHSGAADVPALSNGLCSAIVATHHEIRARTIKN
jgi:signal transduction histidine kinase/HPt (histidine-containing phosphotransfer) domain-containing protein